MADVFTPHGSPLMELLGQTLTLLPQRAAYWQERETLLVADPHFGKPEAFRAQSLPVPTGTTSAALARLDEAFAAVRVRRLVILGDFWHAQTSRTEEVLAELVEWRSRHGELAIELVLGNHDRGVGRLPVEWDAVSHAGPVANFPFVFGHFPDPSDDGYVLCGHLHPAVVLTGRGRQRLKLPAFWFGSRVGVLPAFGEFTGGAVVSPRPGDRVFVVAGDQVVPVP